MKITSGAAYLSLLICSVDAAKKLVTPKALMNDVDMDAILKSEQKLENFAYKYWQRNRVFGGEAHEDTVFYIYNQLRNLGTYNVQLQPQKHKWSDSNNTLAVTGKDYTVGGAAYGPSGNVTANLVKVKNLGCVEKNFPAAVEGKIALIERGNCTFSDKVALAGNAKAAGAIIYNNEMGPIAGTLGTPKNPLGPYVPIVFVTKKAGNNFVNRLQNGEKLKSNVYVNAVEENRLTFNVIAETKDGDHENVVALGGHTDSVNQGPGINDDGSGVTGILEIAKKLSKYKVKNAVRFCFWTAEEFGLLGSDYYVKHLSAKEKRRIRLYLNFDMIASPNFVYSIYDGDGSKFNLTGPPGSAQIEALFERYYDARGLKHVATAFDGRSDYLAFIDSNIPAGGLFTGAEELKTPRQAKLFGGDAGVALDANYHQAGDNATNLNLEAFEVNAKAVAYAVATYATDLSSIPRPDPKARRTVVPPVHKREAEQEEAEGVHMACGHHDHNDLAK